MKFGRLFGCIAVVELLAGCYVLQPAVGVGIEPGTRMALEVNDVGRLALGGQMGPEIAHIEGRLVSRQNDEYVLAVSSVKLIRGGEQVWTGERIKIKQEYVSQTFQRRFSRGRTVALGVAFVASMYIVARKFDLFGLGKEPDPPEAPVPPPQLRFPRP